MSNIYKNTIVITNKSLVTGDYLAQIRKVCALNPVSLILREKTLSDSEYEALASEVYSICNSFGVPFYIHSHSDIAIKLGFKNIHLSIGLAEELGKDFLSSNFDSVSISCHSKEDVLKACNLGADRIILGTIFETDCKPGLIGKGLEFVSSVCSACPIPVYCIGGIKPHNLMSVMEAGAAGGCMMSEFMRM